MSAASTPAGPTGQPAQPSERPAGLRPWRELSPQWQSGLVVVGGREPDTPFTRAHWVSIRFFPEADQVAVVEVQQRGLRQSLLRVVPFGKDIAGAVAEANEVERDLGGSFQFTDAATSEALVRLFAIENERRQLRAAEMARLSGGAALARDHGFDVS